MKRDDKIFLNRYLAGPTGPDTTQSTQTKIYIYEDLVNWRRLELVAESPPPKPFNVHCAVWVTDHGLIPDSSISSSFKIPKEMKFIGNKRWTAKTKEGK